MKLFLRELAVLNLMEVLDQKNRVPYFTKKKPFSGPMGMKMHTLLFPRKTIEWPKYFKRMICHDKWSENQKFLIKWTVFLGFWLRKQYWHMRTWIREASNYAPDVFYVGNKPRQSTMSFYIVCGHTSCGRCSSVWGKLGGWSQGT